MTAGSDLSWLPFGRAARSTARKYSVCAGTRAPRRWRSAANTLQRKSLNQVIRERLAAEEQLRAFLYVEEDTPAELIRIYEYGDLIHWDKRSAQVAAFGQDRFTESDRRLAFLDAASGLAHLYIGFAELARTAIGRVLAS